MSFVSPFQYDCNKKTHCEITMFAIGNLGNQLRNMEITTERTIILWGQDDVLMMAIETLLGREGGWKVVRVSDELDDVSLAQLIEQIIPDVVIVHESSLSGNVRLLIKFIQDYPQLKIITIGLENNKMDIYNKKTICIKESSDLLAAIGSGTTPER